MAKRSPSRTVQCYHCRHRFEVSALAQSVGCPACNKPVIVENVIVKGLRREGKLRTCGKLVIHRSGRVMATLIEAHQGIDAQGALDGQTIAGGPVTIGPKARWRGDLQAPSVTIKLGARIAGGRFQVPVDPLGVQDLLAGQP